MYNRRVVTDIAKPWLRWFGVDIDDDILMSPLLTVAHGGMWREVLI
jgi:hypothetical protein